jgi:hypothetical protein
MGIELVKLKFCKQDNLAMYSDLPNIIKLFKQYINLQFDLDEKEQAIS